VTHVHARPDGAWLLGCNFISRLSEEEVRGVLDLDHLLHAPPVEDLPPEDLAVTPPVAPTACLEQPEGGASAPAPIRGVLFQARLGPSEVLRWYIKRLDLFGTWPLEEGKLVALQFAAAPGNESPLEMEVRSCQLHHGCWVVNCRFVAPPGPEVLRALGHTGS
jgi:hypothetical protein